MVCSSPPKTCKRFPSTDRKPSGFGPSLCRGLCVCHPVSWLRSDHSVTGIHTIHRLFQYCKYRTELQYYAYCIPMRVRWFLLGILYTVRSGRLPVRPGIYSSLIACNSNEMGDENTWHIHCITICDINTSFAKAVSRKKRLSTQQW